MSAEREKHYAQKIYSVIRHAAQLKNGVSLSDTALTRWDDIYYELNAQADEGGMIPKLLHRAEAQVLRMALILALAEECREVGARHLDTALLIWHYSKASVLYVFGATVDEDEQKIINFIHKQGGEARQTDIHQRAFSGRSSDLYGKLLDLESRSVIERRTCKTKGRPATYWRLTSYAKTF